MNLLALEGMSDGVTVLFTFVLGMLVVFLGMALIILFLAIIGKAFDKANGNKSEKNVKPSTETKEVEQVEVLNDEIDEKTRVAIISAIYALLGQENDNNCEFIVRKIKRSNKGELKNA